MRCIFRYLKFALVTLNFGKRDTQFLSIVFSLIKYNLQCYSKFKDFYTYKMIFEIKEIFYRSGFLIIMCKCVKELYILYFIIVIYIRLISYMTRIINPTLL